MTDYKRERRMSSQVITSNTEAAILGRLFRADRSMNAEVAEYLLSIDFEANDIERMNFLAERAQEGRLTPGETAELDSYLRIGSLLSIMQSKARRLLHSVNAISPHQ